jgi:acetate kinase
MSILVFNSGSSSLKFGLFEAETCRTLASGSIDWADGDRRRAVLTFHAEQGGEFRAAVDVPDDQTAVSCAIRTLAESNPAGAEPYTTIDVVGHRVVHGGGEFPGNVLIDERVKATIAGLAELAPLHNPPALGTICAAEAVLSGAAQVAVFDTAFFAHLPLRAQVYPVPYSWYADRGIRRFGFHGLSHQYCSQRAAEMVGRQGFFDDRTSDAEAETSRGHDRTFPATKKLRIVSCHLGGGCSAAAIQGGVAIAHTMGFTPMEGLMMGTRSGSVDPGVLIHLQRRYGLTVAELDDALNFRSGLLGVSGVSPDFAKVEEAAAAGNPRARLAVEMFADRVRSAIGSMAVTMGGVDVLIFTDRVGENSAVARAAACDGLECLGLQLDPQRNAACRPDADIARPQSPARILVIHTREELMIAREAWRVAVRNGAPS